MIYVQADHINNFMKELQACKTLEIAIRRHMKPMASVLIDEIERKMQDELHITQLNGTEQKSLIKALQHLDEIYNDLTTKELNAVELLIINKFLTLERR